MKWAKKRPISSIYAVPKQVKLEDFWAPFWGGVCQRAVRITDRVRRLSLYPAGTFLSLVMPERRFLQRSQTQQSSLWAMTQTFQSGLSLVWRKPALMTILGIGAFHGLAAEGLDRLWEMHFLENFTLPDLGQLEPIVWFGIINVIANLLSIFELNWSADS